jgi:ketosteroid isomerase-like protein
MLRAVALLAVGCASARPHPLHNTATTPPRRGVIPSGGEAVLLRDTFAAISAGRLDALFALADPEVGVALSCPDALGEQHRQESRRASFENAIRDVGRKPIALLGITHDEVVEHVAGQKTWSCIRTVAQNWHQLEIAVQIGGRETIVEIAVTEVGERWFLDQTTVMTDADRDGLATLGLFADRMCACADRGCATRVAGQLAGWRQELDDLAHDGFAPPHLDRLDNTDEVARYRACLKRW